MSPARTTRESRVDFEPAVQWFTRAMAIRPCGLCPLPYRP